MTNSIRKQQLGKVRVPTSTEMELALQGQPPLGCYESEDLNLGCAVGGVMPMVCQRCPWEQWPLNKEFLRAS